MQPTLFIERISHHMYVHTLYVPVFILYQKVKCLSKKLKIRVYWWVSRIHSFNLNITFITIPSVTNININILVLRDPLALPFHVVAFPNEVRADINGKTLTMSSAIKFDFQAIHVTIIIIILIICTQRN